MGTNSNENTAQSPVTRRRFVKAVGAASGVTGLAGCLGGGSGDKPEKADSDQTVVRQYAGVGSNESPAVKDQLREALWSAGLSEDIYVEIVDGPSTTDQLLSQYRTWLSAGREEPDIFTMDSGWTIPFIQRGQVQSLEELLDSSTVSTVKNDFFEASVASASAPDGTLYGVPEFPDFPTIQYRKDLVEDAGYDTDGWQTEPMSWQRFAEITADVKAQNDIKYGYTFQADSYGGLACCDFNEWMTTWGGAYFGGSENLFGPVNERPVTVNKKGAVDAIRMVRSFIHGEDDKHGMDIPGNIAPAATLGWTEETSRKPFTNGNAVMHRNWPYSIAISGAEDALGDKLGVMPLPYGVKESDAKYNGTGGTASALGGWTSVVNPNSQKKDAVVEVLKAKMTKEFSLWQFETLGLLPPKPEVFNSDEARNVDVMGRYMDALQTAGSNAVPRPVTTAWPDQSGAIASAVNKALQKGSGESPQQAMDKLAGKLTEIEEQSV
ncbi:extracellular solute-binding protein [Haloferax marisrubri]|uniref:Sugar ABC transporter substrate-binding protein n=1 Tax=Haloferax marisrubri TaxID=1544719 RepID=A0A2P4NKQ9_9EURY|nr:extracellular solute-binding protein [Haloferax marisrubri]POG53708.1 sugar ABC transporter substrate-binding protein [Haloferax marisrubri]